MLQETWECKYLLTIVIFAFLTHSQVMSVLLVQGPCFENPWFRERPVEAFLKSPRDLQKSKLSWFLWAGSSCLIFRWPACPGCSRPGIRDKAQSLPVTDRSSLRGGQPTLVMVGAARAGSLPARYRLHSDAVVLAVLWPRALRG